jgi:hypothetical protein
MARSPFITVACGSQRWDVYLRETGQHVALLAFSGGTWSLKMDHYPHKIQGNMGSKKRALERLEREVL